MFDQPITCPADSLYIASRFDSDIHQNTCRLAFHGRLALALDLEKAPDGVRRIKAFKMKQREGTVERFVDERNVIGKGMFKKETDLGMFAGMRVVTDRGEAGAIDGGFGKSGKYKVYFSEGVAPRRKRRDHAAVPALQEVRLRQGREEDGAVTVRPPGTGVGGGRVGAEREGREASDRRFRTRTVFSIPTLFTET